MMLFLIILATVIQSFSILAADTFYAELDNSQFNNLAE